MRLAKPFEKEVFIRLEGEAFACTEKYGRFYSKTKEFQLDCQHSAVTRQGGAHLGQLIPRMTLPPSKQGA